MRNTQQKVIIMKPLFIFISLTLLLSCKEEIKQNNLTTREKIDEVKEMIEPTDKNPNNDEWVGNLYRNNKYNFRIEFPSSNKRILHEDSLLYKWEYLAGAGKGILAKAINREYGITISTLVQNMPNTLNHPDDIWKNINIEDSKIVFKDLMNLQKIDLNNLKVEKGYLSNFNAYIYTSIFEHKVGSEKIEYFSKTIACLVDNKIYNVSISLPHIYWQNDNVKELFRNVLFSYTIEIAF